MFAIIGIVVVIGAILGGYLMEHGNIKVLIQPAELLIIGGAAAGTVLIANPLHILKQIAGGITTVFKGSRFTKQRYLESLNLIYELLNKARRQGLMSLETAKPLSGKGNYGNWELSTTAPIQRAA